VYSEGRREKEVVLNGIPSLGGVQILSKKIAGTKGDGKCFVIEKVEKKVAAGK